jgi:hypothetical protein
MPFGKILQILFNEKEDITEVGEYYGTLPNEM